MVVNTSKKIKVVFPDIEKSCIEFSIYQICNKKKKKIEPVNIFSKKKGPTFSLFPGKNYELVIHSNQGRVESGVFSVDKRGIQPDDSRPPPVYPILIKKI